jgi:hypothetical protein
MGVPWIEVSSEEGEEDESSSIPWFGAPLEMLLTIGLAAVLLRRQD